MNPSHTLRAVARCGGPARILFVLALPGLAAIGAAAHAQAVPPPGVDAARPPTERTLQPVDRAETRDRVRVTQDCRKVEADIREQFRIQAESVRTQYASKLAAAADAARESLQKERDGKLATLRRESDSAAKKLGAQCREGNRELLHGPTSPAEVEGR